MNRWDELVRSNIDLLSPGELGSLLVLKSQTTKGHEKIAYFLIVRRRNTGSLLNYHELNSIGEIA